MKSTHSHRYLTDAELAAASTRKSDALGGPEDTMAFCEAHFEYLATRSLQEELHVLTLDPSNCVIASYQVTVGLLDMTYAHVREVFRPTILDAAKSVILVHNHPSGKFEPSFSDFDVTRHMVKAGKLLDIPVLDHIIASRSGTKSLRDHDEDLFTSPLTVK